MAAGPQKWVKLVDFLKTTYPLIINDLTAKKDAQVSRLPQEQQYYQGWPNTVQMFAVAPSALCQVSVA